MNKEEHKKYNKKYNKTHKKEITLYKKEYYNKNKEKIYNQRKRQRKEYNKCCPQCVKEFITTRKNKKFCSTSCRLKYIVEKQQIIKYKICPICLKPFKTNKNTQKYCSKKCTIKIKYLKTSNQHFNKKIKKHIEDQFSPLMTWDNRGTYWHVEHAIPLSWLKDKNLINKIGWNKNNLHPIIKEENIKKSNKWAIVGNYPKKDGSNIFFNLEDALNEFIQVYHVAL